jgi:hypothetical protein
MTSIEYNTDESKRILGEAQVLLVQYYCGEFPCEMKSIYDDLTPELTTLPEDSHGYAGEFKVTVEFIPYDNP